ncbi:ATP-dependent DNA helicase RecG [Arcanobacterium ihumii]|uniref:ATP-dependent DNA helicase RecG n=1 Tax=Arcanobacterium ihumii TaxID=2138162 RepID=UPI001F372D5E|nr:ATP-dependent DNA helicase RecG [Arcanobacterium ihumii]
MNEKGDDFSVSSALRSEECGILFSPLDRLLGKRSANALARLNLYTVNDLILHTPFRLARRGELMAIDAVNDGDSVTVVARVLSNSIRPMNNRRGYILTVNIAEGVHELELTFFAKYDRPLKFHASKLGVGTLAIFSGTVSSYRGALQLTHPEYDLLDDDDAVDAEKIARPIPIYHAASKVPSWQIAKAIDVVLPYLNQGNLPDPLPLEWRKELGIPSKFEAIRALHQPQTEAQWMQAQERMKYEEATILQTILARRSERSKQNPAPMCKSRDGLALTAFDQSLPFELTRGQKAVGEVIAHDLELAIPMRRLLQGDVGTGKTIVAVRAMLQAIDAGNQAVLLAPTEVLAQQHRKSLEFLLGDLAKGGMLGAPESAIRLELLTGSMPAKEKRNALLRMAAGEAQLIIGTHALIQENVQIPFLGLLVVDEQHRFGVDQRDKLAEGAHMLVMTATPIPRTVAMTSFGDLNVSILDELPKGRSPIQTNVVPSWKSAWVDRIWERAREEIDAGGQVYVVCSRISPTASEDNDDTARFGVGTETETAKELAPFEAEDDRELYSVENLATLLRMKPEFEGKTIAILHGQMRPEEKSAVMHDFSRGRIDVLVSTTVIEVGVDVPNASLMVIMDADRFGLSQLHQLRGRIGRGSRPGLCLALHSAPEGTIAQERLNAFAQTTDGFKLAQKDLDLRAEGNVLGAQQSGRGSGLRFLSVLKDEKIITRAKDFAFGVVERDPSLGSYPALVAIIEELENSSESAYLEKG